MREKLTCTVADCGGLSFCKGLCTLHYERQRRTGAPPCSYPGCLKPSRTRGLCRGHYRQKRDSGGFGPKPPCIEAGCERTGEAKGLCGMHYQRVHNRIPCEFEGCDRLRKPGVTLCRTHWEQQTSGVELHPLDKPFPCVVPRCTNQVVRLRSKHGLCKAHSSQRNRYSLSADVFHGMIQPGSYKCGNEGCVTPEPVLHIDHDHACCPEGSHKGRVTRSCGACVRGWLCMQCNNALGLLKDNPRALMGLLDYISRA